MSHRRVVIVGGGITGLSIAEAIARKAADIGQAVETTVLEADDAPGGKIRSARDEGFVVETGPHGFLDKEPEMFALIDRLGLGDDLLRANEASAKRYIVRKGRLRAVPMKPPQFVTSDILPFSGKLRVAMEPFARARPDKEESVREFAARRIGAQAADVLVDAMVTGIYGGDPSQLSLRSAFPRMYELESSYGGLFKAQLALAREKKQLPAGDGAPAAPKSKSAPGQPTGTLHSFTDGLGMLTRALAERSTVRYGYAAEALDRAGSFDMYRVRGSGEAIEADAVVLTPPAFVSAKLLGPHAPEIATAFEAVPYASITVVVHGFPMRELSGGALDGFGFLIPHGEGRRILGSIWASTVFPDHVPEGMVMFRTLLGGARNPDAAEGTDAEVLARAKAELAALGCVPDAATPSLQRVIRWPRGIPQYTMGHAERVAAADAVESTLPGIFVSGNGFRGVAMLACVADAQKVADRVVRYVAKKSESAA